MKENWSWLRILEDLHHQKERSICRVRVFQILWWNLQKKIHKQKKMSHWESHSWASRRKMIWRWDKKKQEVQHQWQQNEAKMIKGEWWWGMYESNFSNVIVCILLSHGNSYMTLLSRKESLSPMTCLKECTRMQWRCCGHQQPPPYLVAITLGKWGPLVKKFKKSIKAHVFYSLRSIASRKEL